jgi:hypothetical protein
MVSCYLCGSSNVKFGGAFEANEKNTDSVDWLMGKLQKGKSRVFVFYLCSKCYNLPGKEGLIEEKILKDAKERTGAILKVKT